MADQTDNLVLEHLRHLRRASDDTHMDLVGIKMRLTKVEGAIGRVTSQICHLQTQIASRTRKIDRMDERPSRSERRLDLIEA